MGQLDGGFTYSPDVSPLSLERLPLFYLWGCGTVSTTALIDLGLCVAVFAGWLLHRKRRNDEEIRQAKLDRMIDAAFRKVTGQDD